MMSRIEVLKVAALSFFTFITATSCHPLFILFQHQRRRLSLMQPIPPLFNLKNQDDTSNSKNEDNAKKDSITDTIQFFELMSPNPDAKPDQMSASSLAYLGDVLFELCVRSRYLWPSRKMSDLQTKVVSIVRAEAQSLLLRNLTKSFTMTPTETTILARGRNSNLTTRKKAKITDGSNSTASTYQDSTALEALIGYTYLTDKNRFCEIMRRIQVELDAWDDHCH